MNSDLPAIEIPPDVLRKWQRIVDLLANIMRVPSAVVTRMEPPKDIRYEVIVSSDSSGNPFPIDEFFAMDIGTFCETVIRKREPLLVANALEDERWRRAPEIQVGMVSYLGFPVLWPDGRIFVTICVLDDKTNYYSDLYQEVLSHCRDVLQADLQTLTRLGNELEEQVTRLRELFARVPEAVAMVDGDFRITRINPEFTKVFGYTTEEAIGRKVRDLVAPDELRTEVDGFMQRMIHSEDVFTAETVRCHKNGARVPVSIICVPVPSRGNGNIGYVIHRDITETKRHQEEQRRYHEIQLELALANRNAAVGQLSASIAHELNQPLTGIITNCATCSLMLTSDPPDLDGARQAVVRTLRDGERAANIVERLRALFRKEEPAFQWIDLNEAAREVIGLSLDEIHSRQVLVRTEFVDDLPRVRADRVQLQQVVLNLLRNALDAMQSVADHPRDLLISTRRHEGDSVQLSVSDTGCGFDPRITARLFEPFYSTKEAGMGIGLSVSRSIIESHQGRLWAVPNRGAGATFLFSIPCVSSNDPR